MLKYLTQFTQSVSIRCGKEGDDQEERLYIQGMDSAHVSLFELKLVDSWFDVFEVPQAVVFSLDIKLLAGILCFRDKEQNIKLELDDDGDKLYIGLISEDSLNKEFEIPETYEFKYNCNLFQKRLNSNTSVIFSRNI